MISCKNNSADNKANDQNAALQNESVEKIDTAGIKVEEVESITGNFLYMADAALFTYCGTGKKVPVSMEGEYILVERAYLNANLKTLEPLFIEIIGDIGARDNGEGRNTPHLIIKKLILSDTKRICE